jgi:hypothetical protein
VVGGVASDEARKKEPAIRALLESAPAPPTDPRHEGLRRAPVLGALRTEFPELALWTAEVPAVPGQSPAAVDRRIQALLRRPSGAEAEGTRRESTPWAYRVLVRQLGVDAAEPRTLSERLALGAHDVHSAGLPDDALLVATLETGVPLLAFDAAKLHGQLALKRAPDGRVVIADEKQEVAALFGETASAVAPTSRSRRIALAAVQAKGVPDLSVEEALWTAIEIMREAG